MALAAAMVIAANIFHSGSILKSQWERLLGSFHNITASTMLHLDLFPKFEFLQRAGKFRIQDELPISHDVLGLQYPDFGLRMGHDFES